MQGLRNVFQLRANNCAILGLRAKVRIPTLRSAILRLHDFLVCAEHIYYPAVGAIYIYCPAVYNLLTAHPPSCTDYIIVTADYITVTAGYKSVKPRHLQAVWVLEYTRAITIRALGLRPVL